MSTDRTSERVTDPLAMRALAHPVRIKLMMALGNGPANVSTLAADVGIPGNQVSFHLRQLEKYGLVRRAERPESATARESWWALTADSLRLGDLKHGQSDEQRVELAGVIAALYQNRAALVADGLLSEWPEDYDPGQRNQVLEARLRLTPAEADELAADVTTLWEKWGERQGSHEPGRDTYVFAVDLFPTRPLNE